VAWENQKHLSIGPTPPFPKQLLSRFLPFSKGYGEARKNKQVYGEARKVCLLVFYTRQTMG